MRTQVPVPAAIERVTDAWYAGRATLDQLEYGVREIPKWLELTGRKLHEGDFMHYQGAVSGMQYDLTKARGEERLRREGIRP